MASTISAGTTSGTAIAIAGDTSGSLALQTNNGTTAVTIDTSQNVIIGTTSALNSGTLTLLFNGQSANGVVLKTSYASTGSTYITFRNSAGNEAGYITQNGTTTVNYVTSSDYRLKENVAPMVGALTKIAQLKPVTYTWKNTNNEVGEGFIAHELQEICPLAVSGEKNAINEDGSIKSQGIDTSKLVALLTASIQELNAKVEAQATTIAELQAKVG
jgi:Chaperone of endosialidase